jgi:hypothetical protein
MIQNAIIFLKLTKKNHFRQIVAFVGHRAELCTGVFKLQTHTIVFKKLVMSN